MEPENLYPAGVIGAGSFGTAIANILAENGPVFLLTRDERMADIIRRDNAAAGQPLHERILVTHDMAWFARQCPVIFPIIPSQDFRQAMTDLAPYLRPEHILIHGTKGLDMRPGETEISRNSISTMSEVMREVTGLTAIGCLAGPNLAREIAEGKPAATVVASPVPAVIEAGQQLLRIPRFQVLSSDDLLGVELCGVIKNIMAIAAGAAAGLDVGENARSLLINRGMVEMVHIGTRLGASIKPFLGVAGIGDLMATCNSPKSRNYSVGYRLAMGESFGHIRQTMEETAEGVNTTRIVHLLSEQYGWKTPITKMVYKVLYEDFPVRDAITALMKLPVKEDIDFM